MSISSDEVNYLIYRYLQEAGFKHSAFMFGSESSIANVNINGADVAPGLLISYIQKGLQYKDIETHLVETSNGQQLVECGEPFSLLTPHICSVKKKVEKDDSKSKIKKEDENSMEATDKDVLTLEGHASEVFICAWNPKHSLLASGSGDSTARIWTIPTGQVSSSKSKDVSSNHIELKHNQIPEKSRDVTTLDWNSDGTLLATGSYDGIARVWSNKGELKNTLKQHKGPIFSLKWNKKGDCLLSGSVDKTAIIWDAKTGAVKQQFQFHQAPTLDVDWKDNITFATCSTDKNIFVCELGKTDYLRLFQGHSDEVNAIKWDPSGTLLASCSDDCSAKIWSMDSEKCVDDFKQHTKEIYTIRWSPTGPNSANPNKPLYLASASFDATVKIWDIESGKDILTLAKHRDPVYSVAFSPNGDFVASGSFDRCLHIWSLKDGSLVKTYRGYGGIFEVCWNYKGDKVAACFSNNTICIIDFP